MLVSLMSMYNAINMRHNAMSGMMNTTNSMLSMLNGNNFQNSNLELLHQQDTNNALAMAKHQFMYQVASALEKQRKAMMEDELEDKKGLNIIA